MAQPNGQAEQTEEWRAVAGFEGLYEVSDRGRVRRIVYRNGHGYYPLNPPRILTARPDKDGYLRVQLTRDNRWRPYGVHTLVCAAFHGPRPPGTQAAHWNGHKPTNTPDNLRWATPLEQAADKHRHGTTVNGARCRHAKLTADAVQEIRSRYPIEGLTALAKAYDVTKQAIDAVVKRKVWKHV